MSPSSSCRTQSATFMTSGQISHQNVSRNQKTPIIGGFGILRFDDIIYNRAQKSRVGNSTTPSRGIAGMTPAGIPRDTKTGLLSLLPEHHKYHNRFVRERPKPRQQLNQPLDLAENGTHFHGSFWGNCLDYFGAVHTFCSPFWCRNQSTAKL